MLKIKKKDIGFYYHPATGSSYLWTRVKPRVEASISIFKIALCYNYAPFSINLGTDQSDGRNIDQSINQEKIYFCFFTRTFLELNIYILK